MVVRLYAAVAQLVEHFLGKEEVTGSIPVSSSIFSSRHLERHISNGPISSKTGLVEVGAALRRRMQRLVETSRHSTVWAFAPGALPCEVVHDEP